ncbi:hypothetical protein PCE1_003189 [Barthelona sp. PCE]
MAPKSKDCSHCGQKLPTKKDAKDKHFTNHIKELFEATNGVHTNTTIAAALSSCAGATVMKRYLVDLTETGFLCNFDKIFWQNQDNVETISREDIDGMKQEILAMETETEELKEEVKRAKVELATVISTPTFEEIVEESSELRAHLCTAKSELSSKRSGIDIDDASFRKVLSTKDDVMCRWRRLYRNFMYFFSDAEMEVSIEDFATNCGFTWEPNFKPPPIK